MRMYDETKLRALFCVVMTAQQRYTEHQSLPKTMRVAAEGAAVARAFIAANEAFDKYLTTGETQSIEAVDWTTQTR